MGKKQTENCFRKRSRQTVNKEVKRGCYFILRQIVLQRGIPFEMKLPAYEEPVAYGSLTKEQFNAEIEKGLDDIKAGRVYSADEVEAEMKREFGI